MPQTRQHLPYGEYISKFQRIFQFLSFVPGIHFLVGLRLLVWTMEVGAEDHSLPPLVAELEKLLAQFGVEESKLLFFAPSGMKQKMIELAQSRNQRLRFLFARLARPPSPPRSFGKVGERIDVDEDQFDWEAHDEGGPKKRKRGDHESSHGRGASEAAQDDALVSLPVEMWAHISSYLSQEEALLHLAPVNRLMR
jgi:hypothetical protein